MILICSHKWQVTRGISCNLADQELQNNRRPCNLPGACVIRTVGCAEKGALCGWTRDNSSGLCDRTCTGSSKPDRFVHRPVLRQRTGYSLVTTLQRQLQEGVLRK